MNCLCRAVLGWLRHLRMWPGEPRSLCSFLVLLQQFPSPLGLSLHGSTVAFPMSTSISCIGAAAKRQLWFSNHTNHYSAYKKQHSFNPPNSLVVYLIKGSRSSTQTVDWQKHLLYISAQHQSPFGCVLSPLLLTLYSYDCVPRHQENSLVMYVGDTTTTTIIQQWWEFISGRNKQSCSGNNLLLNTECWLSTSVELRWKRWTVLNSLKSTSQSTSRHHTSPT